MTRAVRGRGVALALIIAPLALATLSTPVDALIVYDPSNYAQNLLSASRALQQVNNQMRALQNQATMLTNMARNLKTVGFPELQQLRTTLSQVNVLMTQAQGIGFRVDTLQREFTRLFPGETAQTATLDQRVQSAQGRLDDAMAAYRQTMTVQSQIAGNIVADSATLGTLADRSQASEGALQVAQAGNQLQALGAKQQLQIEQLLAVQYRAQALDQARDAQSAIDGAAATRAFLGSGTAYTPR